MCLKPKKAVGAGVPLLILALDVKLGLGGCCFSSPGFFLMVEVDYLLKAVGCYKCRCVLRSSLHLLFPQYRNFIVPIPDVVFLFSYHYLCFFLIFLVVC